MHLLLVLVDDLHPAEADLARFRTLGQRFLPPGVTVDVQPIEMGPPVFYESALGMGLAIPGIIHKLLQASGRCDAAILGCFCDPGLAAAREATEIPVVGAGEACAHFSCLLGARFGIVTILDSDIPVIETNVQAIGLAHRCAAVRAIGIPIQRLADEPARTVRRLVEEGRRTLEAGADVLILGCFGFSLLECAPRVSAQLGVPVVDPLMVSVKTAEALVAGGYRVSRRTYPAPDLTPLQGSQWFRSFQTAKKEGPAC